MKFFETDVIALKTSFMMTFFKFEMSVSVVFYLFIYFFFYYNLILFIFFFFIIFLKLLRSPTNNRRHCLQYMAHTNANNKNNKQHMVPVIYNTCVTITLYFVPVFCQKFENCRHFKNNFFFFFGYFSVIFFFRKMC